VTEMGNYTTLPIIADSFVKIGGDGTNILLDDGTVLPIANLPVGVTETSQLVNNGEDGINPFITLQDLPVFVPGNYDLDEFTNNNIDPFAHLSELPTYIDFIENAITDNVFDKSPSENIVYEKLLLKQDNLGYTPINKAGDIMLGSLYLIADPVTALEAATKQYVDNIAAGITFHAPVYAASTGNLSATYNNGVSGVGATLTALSTGALVLDGEYLSATDRILVWQQTDEKENGIYDVTVAGDISTPYELTRSPDSDNSPPGELKYGDYTFILAGNTNGGKGFICNTLGIIIIGTTLITFVQFNAAQIVTPGYGLFNPSPNIIAVDPVIIQEKLSLTTTGGSGPATLVGNVLNIPQYSGNPGTITSITVQAPLTGGVITTNGTIGIQQASALLSGALSFADWIVFNNKQNEIIPGTNLQYWRGDKSWQTLDTTVVAENTNLYFTALRAQTAMAGLYEVPLTFSLPLLRTGNNIAMSAADIDSDGYLTFGDWNTFMNKQAALVSNSNIKTVGGVSLLGSGDVPLILPIREVSASQPISNTDNGVVILVTATCSITIPPGLIANFECSFVTAPSAVLTIVLTGGVTMINNSSLVMLPQLSFTLKQRPTLNTYIATGNM